MPLIAIQHYRVCRFVDVIKAPLRAEAISGNLNTPCDLGVFVTIKFRGASLDNRGVVYACAFSTFLRRRGSASCPLLLPRDWPGVCALGRASRGLRRVCCQLLPHLFHNPLHLRHVLPIREIPCSHRSSRCLVEPT